MHMIPRLLPDGVLVYPKKGTPPPVPEGYRRKSDNLTSPDAWIMLPLWRDCPFRICETSRREDCRCITYVYFCGHPHYNRPRLTISMCKSCTL